MINSEPKGKELISGKHPMTEEEGHIFVKYTIVAMVHMIYYTMGTSYYYDSWFIYNKTTCICVLYFFIDSSSWADPKSNTSMVSHMINEFKFQNFLV